MWRVGAIFSEPRSMEDKFSFNVAFSRSFKELPFACMWISSIQYHVLHAVREKYLKKKCGKKRIKCYAWFDMVECRIKISWKRWYNFWADFTATTKQLYEGISPSGWTSGGEPALLTMWKWKHRLTVFTTCLPNKTAAESVCCLFIIF